MRRRIVTLALATTSLVAIAFLVPLAVLVSALADDRAVRPAELAARSLAPTAALVDRSTLDDVVAATLADVDGSVSVVFPDGAVVGTPVEVDAVLARVRTTRVAGQVRDGAQRRILVPVVAAEGVVVVDVRVVVDRSGVVVAWASLAGLGLALVVAATALADRLARVTVRAASALEETAVRLSDGQLTASAGVTEPPDLARVSAALDQLAHRIDELLAETREQAADLSHGLRTPLTALRLDLEALPASEERGRLLVDLDALDDAVSRVIDDARAPARSGATGRHDLVAVVADRVAFWAGLAEDEQRPLVADLPQHAVHTALAPGELATVLDVLLDNVFRHTPSGVAARVRVQEQDGRVLLEVADDGPGFPVGVDVLQRGLSGAGGSGLGLDIVRRAAEQHGGTVRAAVAPSGGALVTIDLPAR